jgi:hypothetical protein
MVSCVAPTNGHFHLSHRDKWWTKTSSTPRSPFSRRSPVTTNLTQPQRRYEIDVCCALWYGAKRPIITPKVHQRCRYLYRTVAHKYSFLPLTSLTGATFQTILHPIVVIALCDLRPRWPHPTQSQAPLGTEPYLPSTQASYPVASNLHKAQTSDRSWSWATAIVLAQERYEPRSRLIMRLCRGLSSLPSQGLGCKDPGGELSRIR